MDIKDVLEYGAKEIDDSGYGMPEAIKEESITNGKNEREDDDADKA